MSEEQVLYDTTPSMFRNRPLLFLISLITGVGIVLILLPWWLLASNTRLTVTNERVSFKTGILAKNIREIFLSDIRSIEIDQTFQQRIFNTGKVEISSAAAADAEISITGVPNPYEVKRLIDEYRRKNLSAVD